MTAAAKLEGLMDGVYLAIQAQQVATAQQITGDVQGARLTIENAWAPLRDVPPSMIAATGGKIISLMRD